MNEQVRILQNHDSLVLVLKNTYFTHLDGATVQCSVVLDLPALVVRFPEPALDFLMVLSFFELGDQGGWLRLPKLKVVLEISDAIIADLISRQEFFFAENETRTLVDAFYVQRLLTTDSVKERTQDIEDQLYRFLK